MKKKEEEEEEKKEEEEEEEEEEERRTANNPLYLSTYWSFNRFLKTDIEEDNFTLSSIEFHTAGP